MVDILDLQKIKIDKMVDDLVTRFEEDFKKFPTKRLSYLENLCEEIELVASSPGILKRQKDKLDKLFDKAKKIIKNIGE